MENKFIRVDEVAKELDVSKPYAYKIIRQLNEELKAKGFITIVRSPGRGCVPLPSSCCVHPSGGKANPLEQTLQGQVADWHCEGDHHAGQQQ